MSTILRDFGRHAVSSLVQGADRLISKPYSTIYLASDNAQWVLDWETKAYINLLREFNIPHKRSNILPYHQCVYYSDMFMALSDEKLRYHNRLGIDYFHGNPKTSPEFKPLVAKLKRSRDKIGVVRISHSGMKEVVLDQGIPEEKIFQIPIGINLDWFPFQIQLTRSEIRAKLNIPENAFVVGSFQKDGNGWGEGLEAKWVKGPDVFLKTIKELKATIPELWVLLTGSARGYVIQGLKELGVPYVHTSLEYYPDIGKYFQVLDLYIIASREEGGPKAILESMATGVPLVTTKVGQAIDLVKHGENGWMVESEDYMGLAEWGYYVFKNSSNLKPILERGLETARKNTYDSHRNLYQALFQKLLEG